MASLRKKTLHAVGWRTLVDIGEQILLIVFTAVLARLLTKADFGLIAMALLVNRFVYAMTQIGFNAAIIQSQEITQAQVSAIFLIQVTIGFFTSLICHLLSPLAAVFFNEPQLVPVIQTLSWVLFVNSLAFPQVFLQKQVQFRGLSLLELGTMLVSNIVGIVMAFGGFGLWSLVCRLLLHRGLFVIGVWPLVKWRPSYPSFSGINNIFRFGLNMYGSHIFYYFSQNLIAIIIGKMIGAETLGSFNIAYNLAMVPAQKVRDILMSALYPSFCVVNQNIQKFKKAFFESLFTLGIIFIPAMLGLAVVADDLVVSIYGSKWKEAGLFLSFLAFVGLLKGIEHVLRSVILAKGWSKMILIVTILETAISLPMMYYGLKIWNVSGLLYAYLCASAIAFVFSGWFAQKTIQDNTIFFQSMGRSFVAAVLMTGVVLLIKHIHYGPSFASLILQIVGGVIAYIIIRLTFLTKEDKNIMSTYPALNYLIAIKKI